jgi:hypothetical protein
MKENIELVSNKILKSRGFTRSGWVYDNSTMSEIRHDYLAKGYVIVFQKIADRICYWHRPCTADELDTIKQFSQLANDLKPA